MIYSALCNLLLLGTVSLIANMAADTLLDMENDDLESGVKRLKNGGVVAIPTDTLYGLAADVFSRSAIDRVFAVKGRPKDLALPVLVSNWDQVVKISKNLPSPAQSLANRFWPGGLTLVVEKADGLPEQLTAGGPTVAVRMPAHPVPIHLIDRLGSPITGTSANISGGPDIPSLVELTDQLGDMVDHVIETGPEPKGIASTIIDITIGIPKLLRQGVIPFDSVLETWETGLK